MGRLAYVFAGQGAQYPGMGKDLYETFPLVKALFDAAEKSRPGTLATLFEGTPKDLAQTVNTQPCVFLVDLAAALVLREEAGIVPDGVAGFSLGELAAVCFAGYLTPQEGFALVCKRAKWMQDALAGEETAMAAVLKLPNQIVEEICKQQVGLYPVNYNCPGQLVVAGKKSALVALKNEVANQGGRVVPLMVGGAFHSPFMQTAAESFKALLDKTNFAQGQYPVYCNLTGEMYTDIKTELALQIQSPVLWEKTIQSMANDGFDRFVEVGPGKTLSGLIIKTRPGVQTYHVEDNHTYEETKKAVLANVNG